MGMGKLGGVSYRSRCSYKGISIAKEMEMGRVEIGTLRLRLYVPSALYFA